MYDANLIVTYCAVLEIFLKFILSSDHTSRISIRQNKNTTNNRILLHLHELSTCISIRQGKLYVYFQIVIITWTQKCWEIPIRIKLVIINMINFNITGIITDNEKECITNIECIRDGSEVKSQRLPFRAVMSKSMPDLGVLIYTTLCA